MNDATLGRSRQRALEFTSNYIMNHSLITLEWVIAAILFNSDIFPRSGMFIHCVFNQFRMTAEAKKEDKSVIDVDSTRILGQNIIKNEDFDEQVKGEM